MNMDIIEKIKALPDGKGVSPTVFVEADETVYANGLKTLCSLSDLKALADHVAELEKAETDLAAVLDVLAEYALICDRCHHDKNSHGKETCWGDSVCHCSRFYSDADQALAEIRDK